MPSLSSDPSTSSSPSPSPSPSAEAPLSSNNPNNLNNNHNNHQQNEEEDLLPFESVFFMGFFRLSKLVADSAWKNIAGEKALHLKSDLAQTRNQASSSTTTSTSTTSSSSTTSTSTSSNSSPSSPSSPSPSSSASPPSSTSPSSGSRSGTINPSKSSGSSSFPPPSKEKGWNEMCLGVWKKSPESEEDGKGHCMGIAIIRASSRKELDELIERPMTGIRLCILSEEMEREKAIEKQKVKTESPVKAVKPAEELSIQNAMKTLVEKEYQFVKRFTAKIMSGEVFVKVMNAATYTATKMAKDIKERFSGKNSSS